MPADYDELRPDVKESHKDTLEAVKKAGAPDPRSIVRELDADDSGEGSGPAGGEILDGELDVRVVPPAQDEFVCQSCFLVRHRAQKAAERDGLAYCHDCEG